MTPFPTSGEDWSLRTATAADRPAVTTIWAQSFGAVEADDDCLSMAFGDAPATCVVATDPDDQVVGFIVVALVDQVFLREYLDDHPVTDSLPARVTVIHMLGVDPEWRSTGVATGLVQCSMNWATGRAPMMVVVLWRRENHVDSSELTRKFDYEEVCTLDGYYDGREECPDCQETCTCDATVHVKDLDSPPTH